jgi:hypothetical protein
LNNPDNVRIWKTLGKKAKFSHPENGGRKFIRKISTVLPDVKTGKALVRKKPAVSPLPPNTQTPYPVQDGPQKTECFFCGI